VSRASQRVQVVLVASIHDDILGCLGGPIPVHEGIATEVVELLDGFEDVLLLDVGQAHGSTLKVDTDSLVSPKYDS
jgi:hypothetical protein